MFSLEAVNTRLNILSGVQSVCWLPFSQLILSAAVRLQLNHFQRTAAARLQMRKRHFPSDRCVKDKFAFCGIQS